MRFRPSIRSIALAICTLLVLVLLVCPLTLLLARAGLVEPPLVELSIGPIGITTQGETIFSSAEPLQTFYGIWVFAERRFLYQVGRVKIPNDGRPISWRGCRLAIRSAVTAYCRSANERR